jgi:SAM-dependent methyltransferase
MRDMKTCWHDDEITPGEMISGANGKYWPKLNESQHASVLKELINMADKKKILDLGCGAAELSTILPENCSYCGADLPHIINLVAKKLHPDLPYIKCNIEHDDLEFLGDYDLIVMNALIDVLDKPLEILGKILSASVSDVLMHRQEIGAKTTIEVRNSYGGKTYKSILGRSDLNRVIDEHGFKISKECNAHGHFSFLVTKQ